jgi:hypothetical protein
MPGSQPADEAEPGGQRPDARLDDTSPWVSYAGVFFLVLATLVASAIAFLTTCTFGALLGLGLRLEESVWVSLALELATLVTGVVFWFAFTFWIRPLWRRLKNQNRRFGS